MSSLQLVVGGVGTLLLAATLVGVSARRRYRVWYAFACYLVIVTAHSVLILLWPGTFHLGGIWTGKEVSLQILRLAMVIELTARVFQGFPGAMATARRVLLLILGVTFAAVVALPTSGGYSGFVGELMPRLLNGTIWLFTSLAVLILWYRLPVHWFPKAILLSYVPYLLVFTVAMNALGDHGWQRAAWADTSNQVAYVLLLAYWVYTAWRPEPRQRALAGPPPAA